MEGITKKIMAYSMLGLMQVGLATTITEAAPLYNDAVQMADRDDHRSNRGERDDEQKRQHDERVRKENERHEKEMKRRPHENEREWRERQEREKERHEQELREIAAFLLGIAIGSKE